MIVKYMLGLLLPPIWFFGGFYVENLSERDISKEWIVSTHPGYPIDRVIRHVHADLGIKFDLIKTISPDLNIYLLNYKGQLSDQELTSVVYPHHMVKYVSKNRKITLRDKRPNDPKYDLSQWNLEIIDAPKAWEFTTGGKTPNGDQIVVAVIDDGFQLNHDDLIDNLWTFDGEVANDGIDNDGNGFIDDVNGWDAKNDVAIRTVQNFHGTGVAGIIGAQGNNGLGISGINWDVKLLPISIDRNTSVDAILSAYNYVSVQRALYNNTDGKKGAYIIVTNNSFGSDNSRPEDFPEWCEYYDEMGRLGILSVAATTNAHVDVEIAGDMPSNCTSKYLITVTSTSKTDLYSQLGFGNISVDLAAPGDGTFTTTKDNDYAVLGSNSSASPHVAGTIALLYSLNCEKMKQLMTTDREAYMALIKTALFEHADQKADLKDITVTGGRLNTGNSMDYLVSFCDDIIENGPFDIINLYPNPTDNRLTVEYQSPSTEPQQFVIYSATGKHIQTITHNPLATGSKKLTISIPGLPGGCYYFNLITGEKNLIRSFVVL